MRKPRITRTVDISIITVYKMVDNGKTVINEEYATVKKLGVVSREKAIKFVRREYGEIFTATVKTERKTFTMLVEDFIKVADETDE